MKLLMKAVLRHIRQHGCQTIFTFVITVLITAMLSTVFHVVSGFQVLLREYALESVGSYHYWFSAPGTGETAILLRQMAEKFKEDVFFSEVTLKETDGEANLQLTVASPGMFTTKQMEKRLERCEAQFRAGYEGETPFVMTMSQKHNYELLVSYGDLHKSNGMYSFLLVFLLVFSVIALASVLILGAVFNVSAVQREREFGLFMSIGASGKKIKQMLFWESLLYIVLALPTGYLLGVVFFECSREKIDNLLHALFDFPPIRLVISVHWLGAMLISAVIIILGSVWKPATRASKIHPIEALRQNKSICVSNKECRKQTTITDKHLLGIPGWLAWKNAKRFRRRYRPVFLAMTVAIVVCFVMTGFRQFTTDIADMTYGGMEYNISIRLESENSEALQKISEQLISESDEKLYTVRKACFLLKQEFPFSEEGRLSGVLESTNQLPDVEFFSLDETRYHEICASVGIEPDNVENLEGVLITAERVWDSGGVTYRGVPFAVSTGDTITIEQRSGFGQERTELEVTVAGLWSEFPPGTKTESPIRMTMLVSDSLMNQLQSLQMSMGNPSGMYNAELYGLVENPEEVERLMEELLNKMSFVSGEISNFSRQMQEDTASIAGFRYLMTALVCLLVLVCLCGNFIVTWTVGITRQKEFSTFSSIGMTSWELRGMRWLEQLIYSSAALFAGAIPGMVCYQYIYNVYLQVYQLEWKFPWEAFAISIGLIFVSAVLAELVLGQVLRKRSIAELLKVDEM